jgi:peptidoglycan/xylan/chitin deacetylase (PgdA/CDA1 family)
MMSGRRLKFAAKHALLKTAKTCGYFERVARSSWRRERVLILAWHGVSLHDEHEWDPSLFISPELLDRRLEAIRRNGCTILPLDEAVRRLPAGTLPERSVVLTFDDGYYNFYSHAVPILKKHKAPATVYLTTYYTGDNRPLPYLSASYLMWRRRHAGRVRITALPGFENADLGSPEVRAAIHRAFVQQAEVRQMNADEKHDVLRRLCTDIGADLDRFSSEERIMNLMTPEQVAALPGSGVVSVDLHTHRHRVPLDERLFSREIVENRELIGQMTGIVSDHFCYPSGVWAREMLPWLHQLGVRSATTCMHGLAAPASNPLLLPRFVDTTTSALAFEAWLCGFAERLPTSYGTAKAAGI